MPTRGLPIHRLLEALDLPIGRWDRHGRLLACNEAYVAWAGRPRQELLGSTVAELFGAEAWASVAPSFAAAFEGKHQAYERKLTHKPGGAWVRVQVHPDRDEQGRIDAVFTTAVDIDSAMRQREMLHAAHQRLERFAENIPYPLTYVDRDFVLRFVNKAYCQGVGHAPAALIGRHIGEVRGPRRWTEHEPYFRRALEGETVHYTRLTRLVDIGERWMRTSYVPDVDEDHEVVGVYTVTVDVHELTLAREQLQRTLERDTVTGAYSRRAVMERLDAAVAISADRPVALFFVDLDGFKAVNDELGHREGDSLLAGVASALQAAVRAEDMVGRFGGDEFIVLASMRDDAGAHALAQHLLQAVSRGGAALPGSLEVHASIGYALAPSDSTSPLKLLQLADEAMYAAKKRGRHRALHCAALAALK